MTKAPKKKIAKKQRRERGFDDTDLWNLDRTIAKFVLPRLKEFRKKMDASPPMLTEAQWEIAVDRMIAGFELYAAGDDCWNVNQTREAGIGLALFGKYFGYLWI